MEKMYISRAIVVEGRDDVRAVSEACDALIIATHGFGISRETWNLIEKADSEKGLIILTDPDHAGEGIRRRITDKFPDAVQAYLDREDATEGSDTGVENAKPHVIAEALAKALDLHSKKDRSGRSDEYSADADKTSVRDDGRYADMKDMQELGLSGGEGSSAKRAKVCKELGIGYANAAAMIKKLRGFGIDRDELRQAVKKIEEL